MTWLRSSALVLVLCAGGLIEAWLAYGSDIARLTLVVALVAPLLWRRRLPTLSLLMITLAFALQVPVEALRVLEETFVCYFALIWGAYAGARHAGSAVTLAAATVAPLAGGWTIGLADRSVTSGLIGAGIASVPVWVGHVVRTRDAARRTLERQSEQITMATSAAASAQAGQSRALVAAELQATLADRVQGMVDLTRRAASQLPGDPENAAHHLAAVEAAGRSALHDMRLTLRVLREDEVGRGPAGPGATTPLPTAAGGRRRAWGLAGGLALAAVAVVVLNVVAGFTTVADFVFPLLLLALAGVGVLMMRRQAELLTAVRQQTGELQALQEQAPRTAAIQERLRLARELHDVVAHHLMVMVVQAGGARRTLERGRPGSAEPLTAIERAGDQVVTELHSLLDLVDPDTRTGPAYGMAELEMLVELARAGGLDVSLSVVGERRNLPGGLDLVAHRIVQEALTNVIRHADADHAQVLVVYGADELTIEVADDGRGLAAEPGAGLGLLGMRERAEMYGGSCELGELPTGGVRLVATLPLARERVLG